jgi:hypothetical protein
VVVRLNLLQLEVTEFLGVQRAALLLLPQKLGYLVGRAAEENVGAKTDGRRADEVVRKVPVLRRRRLGDFG